MLPDWETVFAKINDSKLKLISKRHINVETHEVVLYLREDLYKLASTHYNLGADWLAPDVYLQGMRVVLTEATHPLALDLPPFSIVVAPRLVTVSFWRLS